MKRFHIPAAFLVVAYFLSGCSGNDENKSDSELPPSTTNADAVIGQLPESSTRTSLDISLNVVWTEGDQIRVFGDSAVSGEIYTTTNNNTRTGIFLPEESELTVDDPTRYAVYPASAAASATLSDSDLALDLSGLAAQPYIASLGMGGDMSALPMVASSTDKIFTFKNVCGGIQFRFDDYQALGLMAKTLVVTAAGGEQISGTAIVDAMTGTAVLSTGTDCNSVTVDCGNGAAISSSSGFIIFVPAGTYASGFTFDITDTDGGVYSVSTSQPVTVAAGVVTPLAPVPVSIYYGLANSYRVATAGDVEIDITPYYTLSRNFIHEGIERVDADGEPVRPATGAKIVWQQTAAGQSGSVVSTPSVSGTTLTVPVSGTEGNAVVAICDDNDKILWSYHIWVSEANDVAYNNSVMGDYTMLDRNLGASSTTFKDRNAYGMFYQWGRKDPFPSNLTASRPGGSPYESESTTLTVTENATVETGTIAWATQNPQTRLLSANDWIYSAPVDALWGWVDPSNGVKTIYDPCPAGYRVPDYNSFALLPGDDKGNCNAQYGLNIKTGVGGTVSYYPTSGYLNQMRDITQFLEYRGYMWNNQPSTGPNNAAVANPNRFYYNSGGISIVRSEYRAAGMTVRCMKITQ